MLVSKKAGKQESRDLNLEEGKVVWEENVGRKGTKRRISVFEGRKIGENRRGFLGEKEEGRREKLASISLHSICLSAQFLVAAAAAVVL